MKMSDLIKEFESIKGDKEKWKWLRKNQGVGLMVMCDNDDTMVVDENADEDDDYPDFMHIVAKQVAGDPEAHRGIIFGGSGQGEAMVANRYKGVRAAVFYGGSDEIILLSRWHNNANVLSIGARFVSEEEAIKVVKLWLETEFPG